MYNQSSQAVYWKNGIIQQVAPIGTFSTANAIAVRGSDVYLAGNALVNGVNKAVYWKNEVATVLDNGNAFGIAVQGGDVYVAVILILELLSILIARQLTGRMV